MATNKTIFSGMSLDLTDQIYFVHVLIQVVMIKRTLISKRCAGVRQFLYGKSNKVKLKIFT